MTSTYFLSVLRRLAYASTLCTVFFAAAVCAQITNLCDSANPCVARANVSSGVIATVPVVWRGVANVKRDDNVFSDTGRFTTPDGNALGLVNLPLRQLLRANAIGAPVRFTVNESLMIPANVSQNAYSLGAKQIIFTRVFAFEGLTATGSVTINLKPPSPNSSLSIPEGTAPGATALGINRVSLRFSNGSKTELLETNQTIHAIATVNFDRAGILNAVWEVATPASTYGQAIYQPIQNVRQYLAASRQVALQSPALPSDLSGIYYVRLRILQPLMQQAPIELKYQVNEGLANNEIPLQKISGVQPRAGAEIGAQSEFAWRTQSGAKAYQLEIYESLESDKPLTGLQLKAEQTRSPLSISALSYLEPGRTYYWRVVAVSEKGTIFAASELREIRMQK